MKRLILALVMAAVLLLSSVTVVSAASEEEILASIESGLEWLANDQEADGSWPDYYGDEATTGLALLKLCEYAKEQGFDPYDPEYVYSSNVTAGLDYFYSKMSVVDLSLQDHTAGASGTMDDPDSNSNGVGIYVSGYNSYTTGIGLSALSVCGLPERVVDAPNTVVDGMTQAQIAQDMVDWLAYAQSDSHYQFYHNGELCGEGGWYYWALDNSNTVPDNSNTGYAVLGLAYAEDFGSTIPEWVKTELNAYITCIQDPVNGDANDGGSWYRYINETLIGVNILKTGNLIFEMAFVGDAPNESRVTDATDYLTRHWTDASGINGVGWNGNPAQYQTMFTTMKGLEYMGIDTFDGIDWYEDFSDAIVDQQEADGSWMYSSGRGNLNPTILTAWALLTLEKSSPETPVISVYIDIKPSSCPNPINTKGNGILPVAVLGTYDFDVTTIDPASIRIKLNPEDAGVAPIRWNYEDVATPFEGELCDCHDLNGDGLMDLTLKFDTQEVVALTLTDEMGNTLPLTITGNLMEEFSGTAIEGQDCVRVLEDKKQNKNGK